MSAGLIIKSDENQEIINDLGEFITETTISEDQQVANKKILEATGLKESDIKDFKIDPSKIPQLSIAGVVGVILPILITGNPTLSRIRTFFTARELNAQSNFITNEMLRLDGVISSLRNDAVDNPSILRNIYGPQMTALSMANQYGQNFLRIERELTNINNIGVLQSRSIMKRLVLSLGLFISVEFMAIVKTDFNLWRITNSLISTFISLPITVFTEITLLSPINWLVVLRFWLRMLKVVKYGGTIAKTIMLYTPILSSFISQSPKGEDKMKVKGIDPLRILGETHMKTLSSTYNPLATAPGRGEYNYCGPGTRLDVRDIPNTKDQFGLPMSRPFSAPINALDLGCKYHDYSYVGDGKGGFTEESQMRGDVALIKFIDDLLEKDEIGFLQKLDAKLVKQIFEFKLEFVHGKTFKQLESERLKPQTDAFFKKLESDPDIIKIRKEREQLKKDIKKERMGEQERKGIEDLKMRDLELLENMALKSKPEVEIIDIYDAPLISVSKKESVKSSMYDAPIIKTIKPTFKPVKSSMYDAPISTIPPIPPIPPNKLKDNMSDPIININIPKPKNFPNKQDFEKFKLSLFFIDEDDKERKKILNQLLKLIKKTKKKFLNGNSFIPVYL